VTRRITSPVFVGRRDELQSLSDAVERARRGEPSVVLVAGEAGVGKTRLVDELASHVRATGVRVLIGGCIDLGEDGPAYAPLVGALRSLPQELEAADLDRLLGPSRSDLVRLVPDLGIGGSEPVVVPDQAAQARLFEHLLGFVGRLGAERLLILVLEDLHWADRSTRDVFRFLARALRRERVVVIGTYRSDDLHRRHPLMPLLSDLGRVDIVERIDLERLGQEDTAGQLAGILDASPDPSLVERLYKRSDGNPFFVEELIAAGAASGDQTLPTTIREIVTVRVARLPEATQSIMRIVAVIGRRAEHDLIESLADVGPEALVEALRSAVDERILAPTEGRDPAAYEFRHALVQEALYDELLPAERTTLHASLAQLLETDQPETGGRRRTEAEIAYHWYRAHDLPRALAASIRAAGEAAGVFAFAEAHAQLERALELWPRVPDAPALARSDRIAILERAADAGAAAGDLTRAIALGRRALDELGADGDIDRRLGLGHRLAWYQWDQGDAVGAEQTVRDALAFGDDAAPEARARLLSDLAQLHWSSTRYAAQRDAAQEALALSIASGDAVEQARARMMLGVGLVSLGDVATGIAELERAMHDLDGGPDDLRSLAAIEMTHALVMSGHNARAAELGYREVERIRANGTFRRYGAYVLTNLIDPLIEMGRWDDAASLLEDPDWPREGSRASAWMFEDIAELACRRGNVERARWAMAAAHQRVSPTDAVTDGVWLARADAWLARAEGRLEDASLLLRRTIDRSPDPVHDLPLSYWVLPLAISTEADLAEAARARRDRASVEACRDRGRRLVRLVEEIAAGATWEGRGPQLAALVAHARAESSRLEGRSDPDAWAATATAFAAVGEPYDLGVARYREAEALLSSRGDRAMATAALHEAEAIAERLGARPLLGDVESLARRARIELHPARGPDEPARPRPADPYGLSVREREVLKLVALGQTNREIGEALFISEKTASVHVTHILDKLGVNSRVEAALLAARASLADSPVAAPAD